MNFALEMSTAEVPRPDDMKTSDKRSDWKLLDVHRFLFFVLDRTIHVSALQSRQPLYGIMTTLVIAKPSRYATCFYPVYAAAIRLHG